MALAFAKSIISAWDIYRQGLSDGFLSGSYYILFLPISERERDFCFGKPGNTGHCHFRGSIMISYGHFDFRIIFPSSALLFVILAGQIHILKINNHLMTGLAFIAATGIGIQSYLNLKRTAENTRWEFEQVRNFIAPLLLTNPKHLTIYTIPNHSAKSYLGYQNVGEYNYNTISNTR